MQQSKGVLTAYGDDDDDDEDLYSVFIQRAQSTLQHLGDFARLLFSCKLQPRSLQSYLNEW